MRHFVALLKIGLYHGGERENDRSVGSTVWRILHFSFVLETSVRLGVPVKVVPISAHDQSDGLFPRKCNQYLGRLCRKKEVVRSLAASGLILLTHLASPNVAAYAEEFNPKGEGGGMEKEKKLAYK